MEITFIRKIDELGRIVIPKDVRRSFDLKKNTYVRISAKDGQLVISKIESECEKKQEA